MTDAPTRKYLIIKINHSNAGFFAYVNFVLNQLIYAETHKLVPVVYFGPWSEDGPNAFHDPNKGDNTWDYYFEPVAGLTYADLQKKLNDPNDPASEADLVSLHAGQLWNIHNNEPKSIYPYPHSGEIPKYEADEGWYESQRSRARALMQRYIRVKPHIAAKVDEFFARYFLGHKVVGVHMRGTDKGTAPLPQHLRRIVRPSEYFPYIDRYTKENGGCRIFVATDQVQFLNRMRHRYGDRVISSDSIRAAGFLNPFQKKGEGYKKGEDVLLDCLLLARSDFLFKCSSAVGEFAAYFNPELDCLDLNETTKRLSWIQRTSIELRHKLWFAYLRLKRQL